MHDREALEGSGFTRLSHRSEDIHVLRISYRIVSSLGRLNIYLLIAWRLVKPFNESLVLSLIFVRSVSILCNVWQQHTIISHIEMNLLLI